jgi:hypothetical protein
MPMMPTKYSPARRNSWKRSSASFTQAPPQLYSCTGNTPRQDDWEFHVSAATMTGTPFIAIGPERQLRRRIMVRKTSPKAN